ncbi:signal peptidase II [Actinomadura sp. 7K507]|uniref:signal peptidase II n=1 Tax=Actinomadura sp. 7K507 TaxID=2530365 RepID=UPI001FB6961F|nr:signal peptidase II [Actinomadura sp. 7K507]
MQTTRGTSLNDQENPEAEAGESTGSPRPRRVGVLIAVALTALIADIVTKIIVVATLQDREPVELLGGLLTLRETRNSGAAFSIGTGYTVVFTLIAIGVVVAILRTARNLRSLPWAICLGLLLGGAVGNLVDRMLRAPSPLKGHVVDWIQVPNFPVFNLADSSIVCGGVLAVLLAARGLQIDGTRLPGKDEEAEEAEKDEKDEKDAEEPGAGAPEAGKPAGKPADHASPKAQPETEREPESEAEREPETEDVPASEEKS